MKEKIQRTLLLLLIAIITVCLTSCGKDDEDEPTANGSGFNGSTTGVWYVSPGGFATAADFREIVQAIDDHELLSDYGRIGKHYAELDEFFYDNGMYTDSGAHLGRFRFFLKNSGGGVIHFIDDMTAELYGMYLYKDSGKYNANGEQRIWHFDAGRYFGAMGYYIWTTPINVVYTKQNNTYVFSNGDIFIEKPEGLQGEGGIWKKFTPNY